MKYSNRKILAMILTALMLVQAMPMTLIGSALSETYYGTLSAPTYVTVLFNNWDNTNIVTQYVVSGGQAVPPEDPSRDGYSFTGWLPASLTVNADTTFTAQYKLLEKVHVGITYVYAAGSPLAGLTAASPVDVYFNKDGYTAQTFVSPAVPAYVPGDLSVTVNPGDFSSDSFIKIVTYTPVGNVAYTVEHWFEKPNIVGDPGASDYALGTTTPSTAPAFSTVLAAPLGSYDGFEVKLREEGTIDPSGSTVLRVFYNRKLIALTFETFGGTYVNPIIGKYQVPVTAPANPTQLGYSFAGWFSDAGLTPPAVLIPASMPANDTRYYAKWTPVSVTYTVVYWWEKPNFGAGDPGTALSNYIFNKVRTASALTDTSVTGTAGSLETIDYAYFRHSDTVIIKGDGTSVLNVFFRRTAYTITFNLGDNNSRWMIVGGTTYVGGSNPARYSITAKFEQNITLMWPATDQNATFSANFYGWDSPTTTVNWVSKRLILTTDMISGANYTVEALWQDVVTRQVNYWFQAWPSQPLPADANDHKTVGGIVYIRNMTYSQVIKGPSNNSLSAKSINGVYYVSGNSGSQYNSFSNYDLYNNFNFNYNRNIYTLSFDTQGGPAQASVPGIMFEQPMSGFDPGWTSAKTKVANGITYSFAGWYLEPGYYTLYNFSTAIMGTSNVQLFAKWLPPVYEVDFDVAYISGGGIIYTENVNAGNKVLNVPTVTRLGYDFAGWYLDLAFTIRFVETQQIYANTLVYAKWTPMPTSYTVEYELLDGTKVWTDKFVGGVFVDALVTENARVISGYVLANPATTPQSITLGPVAASNVITFIYIPSGGYAYTVRYLLKDGDADDSNNIVLSPAVNKITNASQVVEYFLYIPAYHPVQFLIVKPLSSDAPNIITFYYEPYAIVTYTTEHWLQDPLTGVYVKAAAETVSGQGIIGSMATGHAKTFPNYVRVGDNTQSQIISSASDVIVFRFNYDCLTTKTVIKTWSDNNNQDGLRPTSVSMQLKADGVSSGSTQTLTGPGWTYTWNNLLKFSAGVLINYTVVETSVPVGYADTYTTDANGNLIVTNTHIPEVVSVTSTKVWLDADNQDGLRPLVISAQLKANLVNLGAPVLLNAGNSWTTVWNNLPKYAAVGQLISYTVAETEVPDGYSVTYATGVNGVLNINDSHTPATTSVTVSKVWNDNSNQDGLRPVSVSVQLKADGVATGVPQVLTGAGWTYTWLNLPKFSAGVLISYTVEETVIPDGYTAAYTLDGNGNRIITNSHTPATTVISGTKTWNTVNNEPLPVLTVSLFSKLSGETEYPAIPLASIVLDGVPDLLGEDIAWTYSFKNLPVYFAGMLINYKVEEAVPAGYSMTRDGNNFTNTANTTEIAGTKTWSLVPGETAPDVTVTLYRNNILYKTTVITGGGTSYSFTGLSTHDASGVPYLYTVEETVPNGYSMTRDGNNFTNTANTTEISGTKTWNMVPGETAPDVTVTLYRNNILYKTTVITGGGTSYSFTGLPTHDASGIPYLYTVEETLPNGYSMTRNGNNFTNTANTTEIAGTKTWSLVPGETAPDVTVTLYRNNILYKTTVITGGGTSYSFTGLPTHDASGISYLYTVEETVPNGYSMTRNGNNFTNTANTTEITGTKTWNLITGENAPAITIELYRNSILYKTTVITGGGTSYSFTGLPTHDALGAAYAYTTKEVVPAGYAMTQDGDNFTNTQLTTSVAGTKTWVRPAGYTEADPDITIELYRNGVLYRTTMITGGGTSYEFLGLPVNDELGALYMYNINEIVPIGYTVSYDGLAITNTLETVEVRGTKTWIDNNNQYGVRSDITVSLWKNNAAPAPGDIPFRTIVLDGTPDANGEILAWTFSFTDLPKYDVAAGTENVYTISENALISYATTYNGYDITNTIVLSTYTIQYYYRMDPADPYVINNAYTYHSAPRPVGTSAGGIADHSESGFYQLMAVTNNPLVIDVNPVNNVIRVYYQAGIPLGGGLVVNVGDCFE
jgi:uncharacterized repeat protein (TIGR02543 family)